MKNKLLQKIKHGQSFDEFIEEIDDFLSEYKCIYMKMWFEKNPLLDNKKAILLYLDGCYIEKSIDNRMPNVFIYKEYYAVLLSDIKLFKRYKYVYFINKIDVER